MKCNEIRDLLSLYIERELDESQIRAVEDHLAVCDSCKTEYQELSEIMSLLGETEEVPVPEGFESRWKNAIREEKIHPVVTMKKDSKKKPNWRLLTSLAAVFAVGVISVALYHDVIGDLPDKISGKEQSGMTYSAPAKGNDQENQAEVKMAVSPDVGDQAEQEKQNSGNNDVMIMEGESYGALNNTLNDSDPDQNTAKYSLSDTAEPEQEMLTAAERYGGSADGTAPVPTSRSLTLTSEKCATGNGTNGTLGQGLERNTAAVQYYSNLMAEKLDGFDYQVTESNYVNGEWRFKVFIFHGKDGNTYNEDILIIGKEGAIEVFNANEFMGIQ